MGDKLENLDKIKSELEKILVRLENGGNSKLQQEFLDLYKIYEPEDRKFDYPVLSSYGEIVRSWEKKARSL